MTKILILNDLHFGISRESTTHPGIIRQANTHAKSTFESLIPQFNQLNPDLVVHLGDAIRDVHQTEIDLANLQNALSLIKQINAPSIHMLGNHELKSLSRNQIEAAYKHQNIDPQFFGIKEIDSFNILWLDLEMNSNGDALLPEECNKWLQTLEIDNNKPTLVFSHYSLVPIDAKGIWYLEHQSDTMYYLDYQKILESLSKLNSPIHINGHVHILSHQQVGGQHHISCPSFSEHITIPYDPDNHPGIYSTLEIDQNQFVFTSYSHQFALAKIQGSIE